MFSRTWRARTLRTSMVFTAMMAVVGVVLLLLMMAVAGAGC